MTRPGQMSIVGSELRFVDSNGDRLFYEGEIDNSVSMSGNFRVIGSNIYYLDESGDARFIDSEDISGNGRPGQIWIDESDSCIIFIDSDGERKATHSDVEEVPHSDVN